MTACYLELYEEGEVEISTCPTPQYPEIAVVVVKFLSSVVDWSRMGRKQQQEKKPKCQKMEGLL